MNGEKMKGEDSMKNFILKLVNDYNNYSELVALNYEKMKEGKCSKSDVQWNEAQLYRIEEYLKYFESDTKGVKLYWECGQHNFGFDDFQRQLEYRTVDVVFD